MSDRYKTESNRLFAAILIIFGACVALTYQNCSPVNHSFESEPLSVDLAEMADLRIETVLNTPKNGTLTVGGDKPGFHLSFDSEQMVQVKDLGHGAKLEIIDDAGRVLKFTPAKNRRDKFDTKIYMHGGPGPMSALVLAIVDNGLSEIQPAVAVRGSGCITCHANISSTFITDFGYGSPWFGKSNYPVEVLHGNPVNPLSFSSGSIYGDHGGSLSSTALLNGAKMWVPKANIDQAALGIGNASVKTFGDLARFRFANPIAGAGGVIPSNSPSQVSEKTQIKIGAPSDAQIRALLDGAAWVYYPDMGQPEVVSGLTVMGGTGVLSGDVECSGDLVLDGMLVIKNLRLKSYRGCRIYVTKTVFVQGAISYINAVPGFDLANLQITSSRAILLGMGPGAVNHRFIDMWTEPSYHTRQFPATGKGAGSVWENNHIVMSETQSVFNQGLIADLFFSAGGLIPATDPIRRLDFSRLLLNAPHIHSRYVGNFRGAVIGEIGLFSVGEFKFEFDVLFKGVSVFPLLSVRDLMLDFTE